MDLVRGAVDLRGSYVSKILHVKTKESGPVGGRAPGAPPRSANGKVGKTWVFADIVAPCLITECLEVANTSLHSKFNACTKCNSCLPPLLGPYVILQNNVMTRHLCNVILIRRIILIFSFGQNHKHRPHSCPCRQQG